MNAQAPIRISAPATPLLSLEEAKGQLRVRAVDEDTLIAGLVEDATSHLDGYSGILGRALITQEWQQKFDGFPACDVIRLPLGPLQAVSEVSYFDAAGAAQTFTAFHEVTDAIGPMIVLEYGASWPQTATRPDAVTITWTCGYGDAASDVPAAVLRAVRLMITDWFDRRGSEEAAGEVDKRVASLLRPLRMVGT